MEDIRQAVSLEERDKLYQRFKHTLSVDKHLSRKLVSFQANKQNPVYRWFKYKEGFSSNLVQYYIKKLHFEGKDVLDPFAGVGTTLFASSELGCNATGIELLPVGAFVMEVRQALGQIDYNTLTTLSDNLWEKVEKHRGEIYIEHIPITDGAFPEETETLLNAWLGYCKSVGGDMGKLLKFIAFTILEEISYTRKDGQYLRWDHRSNRRQGKTKFDKGRIIPFKEAIENKLQQIIEDLRPSGAQTLFDSHSNSEEGKIMVYQDSCLTRLSKLEDQSFDLVVTSPPYCNRYDYTRTYALELVFLGCDNDKVKELRQAMLSCTVENKSKLEEMKQFYEDLERQDVFDQVIAAYESSGAMMEVLHFLEHFKMHKVLNNNGVVRMVRNYFLEMCFTTYELARVLRKGGKIVMVNDNVRYAGEEIPVDLILSEFAETFGLTTSNIYVLQQKKGNSSQQMGNHGRTPLRKCVYLWSKE